MYQLHKGRLTITKITILIVCCALGVIGINQAGGFSIPATIEAVPVRKVIVDAGHGGLDGGAIGVHGEYEKEINLKIAQYLKEFLEFSGFEVIMIRETDVSLHQSSADTIAKKKASDLKYRLSVMNSHPDAIVVSIHQNKFTESQYDGAQVFYGILNEQSLILAQTIQESIAKKIQPDNKRKIKKGTKSIYLLMKTKIPIVLVECGFLSHEEESLKLSTASYQKEMAFSILAGIVDYYNSEDHEK